MVYLLKRFLCCIPLRTGAQIVIWVTCLTRLLLVFTTIYLAAFVLKAESNRVVSNYSDISSNSSFYYEIGYGIDQLLFFTKGTYIQRYVILTGLTVKLQLVACVCGLYAVDKGSPGWLVPWLVMFTHACLLETGVSLINIGISVHQGHDLQSLTPDVISAISHGVFLTYFVWVVYSFYRREKLRLARPYPVAPPFLPSFLGEATPPYNPTHQNDGFKEKNKASTLPNGVFSLYDYNNDEFL